jgi:uncharacterized protein
MILRIHVKPNSKTDSISIENAGTIRVKIRAQPVEGKANKYLLEYLSTLFKLPKSKIEIIKGETSSYKKIEIDAPEDYIYDILKTFLNK